MSAEITAACLCVAGWSDFSNASSNYKAPDPMMMTLIFLTTASKLCLLHALAYLAGLTSVMAEAHHLLQ